MNRRAHEYNRVTGIKGQRKKKRKFHFNTEAVQSFSIRFFFLFFINHTYILLDAENTCTNERIKTKKTKETYNNLFP